ncbi:TetR/AcrR family transcriptional regulator [Myxococcota bacterium]|nr:TetR/AcrR family transcriptional regulator [Myxococcota bacterium]
MAQVLKEEVRARILDAALEIFAARGFVGATMGQIAERASLATGALYRYYPGKQELFDAVITPELAREHERLLEGSVRSMSFIASGAPAPAAAPGAEVLLRFWVEHRLAVVVLLDRAEGTAYQDHGARFVEQLVKLTIAELREAHPGVRIGAPVKAVLTRIFESTRRTIAALLEENDTEESLRTAIAAFRSYQVAGLRGFVAWVTRDRAR